MPKKTQEEAVRFLRSKNCELISEYAGYNKNIDYICHCGERESTVWKRVLSPGWSGCKRHTLEKRVQTNLKKWGVKNVSQCPIMKEKAKKTNIEKYGYPSASQAPLVKEKIKTTNKKKYGVGCAFSNEEIKQKIAETNLKKRGVKYMVQSAEFKEKAKATNMKNLGFEHASQSEKIKEKKKITNMTNRGVENPFHSQEVQQKIRKTLKQKYGVEHPAQNAEIFSKMQKSLFSTKKYTFPSGRELECRGYEPQGINLLLGEGISENDIISPTEELWAPIPYIFDKERKYFPDLFVISKNMIVEIKSVRTYTFSPSGHETEKDKTHAKLSACRALGYNTRLIVFKNNKGAIFLDQCSMSEASTKEI
nr:putative Csr/MutH/archaeal HJR family nuclease [Marseillevirus cajuinensis]